MNALVDGWRMEIRHRRKVEALKSGNSVINFILVKDYGYRKIDSQEASEALASLFRHSILQSSSNHLVQHILNPDSHTATSTISHQKYIEENSPRSDPAFLGTAPTVNPKVLPFLTSSQVFLDSSVPALVHHGNLDRRGRPTLVPEHAVCRLGIGLVRLNPLALCEGLVETRDIGAVLVGVVFLAEQRHDGFCSFFGVVLRNTPVFRSAAIVLRRKWNTELTRRGGG